MLSPKNYTLYTCSFYNNTWSLGVFEPKNDKNSLLTKSEALHYQLWITHTIAIWTFSFHQNSEKINDEFLDLTLAQ